jgi:hypothetical protein
MKPADLDAPTWSGNQGLAARLAAKLRSSFGQGYRIHKDDARKCAEWERIANFDKKITEHEIIMRLRAGSWK